MIKRQRNKKMKRIYVKPELQITTCFAEQFLAGYTKDVEWDTNTGGTDTKIDDTTEPDPEGAKRFDNFSLEDWSLDY